MAESISEIVAKLKAQKISQPSEESKPQPKTTSDGVEEIEDEEDEGDEESGEKAEKITSDEKALEAQVSCLQNNGVFRLEILRQMNELNQHLSIISRVLIEVSGIGKDNEKK